MDKLMQLIACEARSEGICYDTTRPYLDDEILLYGTRVLLDLMIFVGTCISIESASESLVPLLFTPFSSYTKARLVNGTL